MMEIKHCHQHLWIVRNQLKTSTFLSLGIYCTNSSVKQSATSSGLGKANPERSCNHLLTSLLLFFCSFESPRFYIFSPP